MIVIERAVTLHTPKTVPRKWLGKYYSVHMYTMLKAELTPN